MKALSVFSGLGGLDIAAEAAGIEVVGQIEYEPACIKVLEHHWPDVYRWKDVRDVTGADVINRCGRVDLIFGGPPCQPVSVAGKRKASGDERNMWPAYLRLIREIRPRWIVAENPTGILSAEEGRFFGNIIREITEMGYCCGWGVWGACDVGAPHKRERVFVMAYCTNPGLPLSKHQSGQSVASGSITPIGAQPHSGGKDVAYRDCQRQPQPCGEQPERRGRVGNSGQDVGDTEGRQPRTHYRATSGKIRKTGNTSESVGYADSERQQELHVAASGCGMGQHSQECSRHARRILRRSEPRMGRVFNGTIPRLDCTRWPGGRGQEQYDWEPPRVVPGKTVPGRVARIKMLGNAVVPQQAALLFEEIMIAETQREGQP